MKLDKLKNPYLIIVILLLLVSIISFSTCTGWDCLGSTIALIYFSVVFILTVIMMKFENIFKDVRSTFLRIVFKILFTYGTSIPLFYGVIKLIQLIGV